MIEKCIHIREVEEITDSVLVYGHFSTIHPGHIRYLRNASKKAKNLVVVLIGDNDKSTNYHFSQRERAEGLSTIEMVSNIVLLDNVELITAIKKIKPSVLVLGKEFEETDDNFIMDAVKSMKEHGGKVEFHAGPINYATVDLLKDSTEKLQNKKFVQFKNACKKQGLFLKDLLKAIDKFKDSNLIVIGDSILDQYAACEALGMSAEAPVVVVKELEHKNFIGGAALVAANVSSLGAKCDFISVIGDDENAKLLIDSLETNKVLHHLIIDDSRSTTFKKRYMVENQKLFRVSKLNEEMLNKSIEKKIINKLETLAPKADGIIVSDFVYGVITTKILKRLYELAKEYNLMLFGDLQCSSQVGSVTKFLEYDLICPNEREARIALQDKESGLEILTQKLFQKTDSKRIVMKLGGSGFIAYDKHKEELLSQSFPALSSNPIDVSGAGDSLLSVLAVALSSNESIMTASAIGTCRAAIAVDTVGNYPIGRKVLKEKIKQVFES